MKVKKIFYLDLLRVLACIAVVLIHVSGQNFYNIDATSTNWHILNIYNGIGRWAVPIFVMISGALMLGKNKSIKTILRKNIMRIIIAFLVWSFIYTITSYIQNGTINIHDFLIGPFHLWFLIMLICLYLLIPLLDKILESKKTTKYFLILSLFFTFIIPWLNKIITTFFIDSTILNYYISNFYFALGYTPYFVLGYILNNTILSKRQTKYIYFLGAIGFLITIFMPILIFHFTGIISATFSDGLSLNILFESLFVFVFIKNRCTKKETSSKSKLILIIEKLAPLTFGVYLIHILILNLLAPTINTSTFNPILSVPILTILVLIISLSIIYPLSKIPKINKFIT